MTLLIGWFFVLWVASIMMAYQEGRFDARAEQQRPAPTQFGADLTDDWRRALFQTSLRDIQWSKDRAWTTVQWCVLLLGALAALSQKPPFADLGRYWFWTLMGLAATVTARYLWELHTAAKKARHDAADVLDVVPGTGRFRYDRTAPDWHHVRYLVFQYSVVAMATLLAFAAVN